MDHNQVITPDVVEAQRRAMLEYTTRAIRRLKRHLDARTFQGSAMSEATHLLQGAMNFLAHLSTPYGEAILPTSNGQNQAF